MNLRQFNIKLPGTLLDRLRDTAASQGRTQTELVRSWIEAGLSGELGPACPLGSGCIAERLAALEELITALRAHHPSE